MIHTVNHHTAYSYSKFTCRAPNLVKIKLKNTLGFNSSRQGNKTHSPDGYQNRKSQIFAYQSQTPRASAALSHHGSQRDNFFKAKPLLCWRSDLAFFNLRYYFLNCFKALHLCWNASRNNKRIAFVGANGNLLDMADLASYGHDFKNKGLTRDVLPRLKSAFLQPLRKTRSIGNRLKPKKTAQATPGLMSQRVRGALKPAQAYGLLPLRLLGRYLQTCHGHGSNIEKLSRFDSLRQDGEKSYQSQIQNKKQHCLQGKIGLAAARRPALLYNDTSTGFFSNSALSCPSLWNPFLALAYKNTHQIDRAVGSKRVFGFQGYNLRWPLDGIVPNVGEAYLLKKPSYASQSRKTLFERAGVKRNTKVYINSSYRNLCVQALFKLCFGPSFGSKKDTGGFIKKQNKKQYKQTQCLKFLFSKNHARPRLRSNSLKGIRHAAYINKRNTPYDAKPLLRASRPGSKAYQQGGAVHRSRKASLYTPKSAVAGIVYGRHLYNDYVASRRNFKKRKYYASFLRVSYGHDFKKFATNSNLKQADAIFFTHPDKTAALASQARRLRLPTIGLVSGLKVQHGLKHKQHNVQKDSVDYPILGNPNNSFFVFMVLRMFLNVIHHAPMPRGKSAKVTKRPQPAVVSSMPGTETKRIFTPKGKQTARAKVTLMPRAETSDVFTAKADKAPGKHLKRPFITKAVQQRAQTYRDGNHQQSRRGPTPTRLSRS